MRPVNLLPAKHRPRTATGTRQGSSRYVLAGLGVVLVAVLAYVLTLNSINSKRDGVAKANADTAQYQAHANQLSAYGDFAQVKEQRIKSIKDLAQGRLDWELLIRQLSHVLPDGTWLTTRRIDGQFPNYRSNVPSVQLSGCAESQDLVATMLVRLRQLEGEKDVSLEKSERPDNVSTGAAGSTSGGADGCGATHGAPNYAFTVDVTLSQTVAQDSAGAKVPASLGGGS